MKKFLMSSFNIEESEFLTVALIFSIGFLWGSSQMFSYTSANALFLKIYGANDIGFTFIINAILIPVSGLLIMQLSKHLTFSRYMIASIIALCVAITLFYILLMTSSFKFPAMMYMVWLDIEFTLANVLFMSIMNKVFNIRQSKRLFSICGFGNEISYILSGLLIPLIVKFTGALHLTAFAIGLNLLSIVVFISLVHSRPNSFQKEIRQEDDDDSKEGSSMPLSIFIKNRFIRLILAIAALSGAVCCFIDNAYYIELQAYFSDEVKIASFVSFFYSISSAIILVINGFFTAKCIRRFGISASLLITPILLLIAGIGLVITLSLGIKLSPLWIFSVVVMIRLLYSVNIASIQGSAYFNLFQSIPAHSRDTVINFSETFIAHITSGIAGLVLLIMTKKMGASTMEIIICSIVLCLIWIVVSLVTGRRFIVNLQSQIERNSNSKHEISISNNDISKMVQIAKQSKDHREVISSIEILEKNKFVDFHSILSITAVHENLNIRLMAAEMFEKYVRSNDFDFIKERINGENDDQIRARWLMALGAVSEGDDINFIKKYIVTDNDEMIAGAICSLIKHCGLEGIIFGGAELIKLCNCEVAAKRKLAASIIGKIAMPQLYQLLIPLLQDPDIEVKSMAINAAEKIKNIKLIPILLEKCFDSKLVCQSIRAITITGHANLDGCESALEDAYSRFVDKRKIIINIYGRLKSIEAIKNLLNKLSEVDSDLNMEIIKSLESCRYVPGVNELKTFENLLFKALHKGSELLAMEIDFKKQNASKNTNVENISANSIDEDANNYSAIIETLISEKDRNKEYIFALLGMLYRNSVMSDIKYNYFYTESDEQRALAIELLDSILNTGHKNNVIAIFEDTNPLFSLNILKHSFPESKMIGEPLLIKNLCNKSDQSISPILRAAACNFVLKTALSKEKDYLLDDLKSKNEKIILDLITLKTSNDRFSIFERIRILKRTTLFSLVPEYALIEIALSLNIQEYNQHENIFLYGDHGETMFIIVEGNVNIHLQGASIANLHQGEIFGEMAALCPEGRSTNATALSKTLTFSLTHESLMQMIDNHFEAVKSILIILCRRLRSAIQYTTGDNCAQKMHLSAISEAEMSNVGEMSMKTFAVDNWKELSTIEKVFLLKSVPIFNNLSDSSLHLMAQNAKEIAIKKGDILFQKGSIGVSLYIIIQGKVRIFDDSTTINILSDKGIIGELGAISSEPRTASISTLCDSRLLKISQKSLYDIMWDQREIAKSIMIFLIKRLRSLMDKRK
ncbi:MAG: cyclic nucleotide-binding domain-containing protein [Oligoflexia bacterium]|nr:cyclic nucleotide-binding domain-containing protein [Oligoflexia bacterium]